MSNKHLSSRLLLAAVLLAVIGISVPHVATAQVAGCDSMDPSDWPSPARPYFMVVFDTSSSMIRCNNPVGSGWADQCDTDTSVSPLNSCGFRPSRLNDGKCAVRKIVQAFSEVDFGLTTFKWTVEGECLAADSPYSCEPYEIDDSMPDHAHYGTGDECQFYFYYSGNPDPGGVLEHCAGTGATASGGEVRVGLPVTPSTVSQMLTWVDDDCAKAEEVMAIGWTPLNGSLRDAAIYLRANETHLTPDCRQVNVILITDGEETCDGSATNNRAAAAAEDLYTDGLNDGSGRHVKVYPIGFAGLNDDPMAALNNIAKMGQCGATTGTCADAVLALSADNETELAQALGEIIGNAIQPEVCDNIDNNCNGCVDEGYKHYCHRNKTEVLLSGGLDDDSECCSSPRQDCIDAFLASISENNPTGDGYLLPCHTPPGDELGQYLSDPDNWLCWDPGEICDEADNNCDGDTPNASTVDENTLKCDGHCPVAEDCDGVDDDCDGIIDNASGSGTPYSLPGCLPCTPSAEICDGCDNDCDNWVDNDVDDIACGLPSTAPDKPTPAICEGTKSCQAPQWVDTAGACVASGWGDCSATPDDEEVCDGWDNDCNGLVDDNLTPATCEPLPGLDYGAETPCELGDEVCIDGALVCQGGSGPESELCDGIDNDCDGQTDVVDGGLLPGEELPCGPNTPPCEPGELDCIGGQLVCIGGIPPEDEVCDGQDNDCNGDVDEPPLIDAPASGNEGCWTLQGDCCSFLDLTWCAPDGGTCDGVGTLESPCSQGTLVCDDAEWKCAGSQLPGFEVCDGIDNDCDGFTDEEVDIQSINEQCLEGVGICEDAWWKCVDDGEGGKALECCNDVTQENLCISPEGSMPEECNGLDDDCNGEIDEDLDLVGDACGVGLGICAAGTYQCVCTGPNPEDCDIICQGGTIGADEVCNGLDDDCDGLTDEDLPLGVTCTNAPDGVPEGICDEGNQECIDGTWQCNANEPAPEACNNLDDDCDGLTDEDLEVDCPGESICIQGVCADFCAGEEMACPPGKTCETMQDQKGTTLKVCVSNVCKAGSGNALECVANPHWCDDGYVPPCKCDVSMQKCVGLCEGLVCPLNKVCVDKTGTCHAIEEDCYAAGCPSGEKCKDGACVTDPCTESACEEGQYCNDDGQCVSPCIDLDCEKMCFENACVDWCAGVTCEGTGEVCNDRTGICETEDACSQVVCNFYEVCIQGDCVEDPCWNITCPNGLMCEYGGCREPDTGMGDTDTDGEEIIEDNSGGDETDTLAPGMDDGNKTSEMNQVLATGLGGCLCTSTPGWRGSTGSPVLGMALLGVLLLVMRFSFNRRSVAFSFAIFTLFLMLLGCEVEPYQFEGNGEGAGKDQESEKGNDIGDWNTDDDTSSTRADGGEIDSDTTCKPDELDDDCDGIDDDCDGQTDEDVTVGNNTFHCGECENDCTQLFDHAFAKCEKGECGIGDCETFYHNVNGLDDDGCEYYCKPVSETDVCNGVDLGDGFYVAVDDDCDGQKDEDVNLKDDAMNCGSCGNICRIPNVKNLCVEGQCTWTECQDNYWNNDNNPDNGCEYSCSLTSLSEDCNNRDDDCDGQRDEAQDLVYTGDDPACSWAAPGLPADTGICEPGTYVCENGQWVCNGGVKPTQEVCNNLDDDCDGVTDDNTSDTGGSCGTSSNYPCRLGTVECQNGSPTCVDAKEPVASETCNGIDDDCNGTVDDQPTDVGGACNVPTSPPPGATSPCRAGSWTCGTGGAKICANSVGPSSLTDGCGDDSNCDGVLTDQPVLETDVLNCGSCGNNCYLQGEHANWTCVANGCVFGGCQAGWYDLESDEDCDYGCIKTGDDELCNGADDDCDGNTDNMLEEDKASPDQVCGVSPAATEPGCTTSVTVECVGGEWQCSFPEDHCDTDCDNASEACDGLDNNCNGSVDEVYKQPILQDRYIGQACASDDDLELKHGLCQQVGTYKCNTQENGTSCQNSGGQEIAGVPLACGEGGGQSGFPCAETCDGKDNDCDGLVDEPFLNKGSNATYWVQPDVVQVGGVYMYKYEASRPLATDINSGFGNGWWRASGLGGNQPAPPGSVTLDQTPACSVTNRIPWFNISGLEAQHVCVEMGGRLCTTAEWEAFCGTCNWSFDTNCNSYTEQDTDGPCNVGLYDFDDGTPDVDNGLLPTGDLSGCEPTAVSLFDLTGNLRELTCESACTNSSSQSFILMGGAFNTSDPTGEGAKCDFEFYNVQSSFKLYDVGFRCCFDANPS